MKYNNYSISSSKKKLYLKSKDPQEGYEKVIYGTDSKVTYHKYFKSISGVLQLPEIKEVNIDNRKLTFFEVTLIDGDNVNRISMPLKGANNRYSTETTLMISSLYKAIIGESVTITIGSTTFKDKEYMNIYINYDNKLDENGKKVSSGFIPYSEIPRAIRDTDPVLGDTYDWTPVTKFYSVKLSEIVSQTPVYNTSTSDIAYDDLPF